MLAASKSTLVEKHFFFFSHHQVKVRNKKLGASTNVLFNNVRMSSFHCSTYFFLTIICSLVVQSYSNSEYGREREPMI